MSVENGEWVIRGVKKDDPARIKSADEMLAYVNEVGFLPLFGNTVPGFSAEEHTLPEAWWSSDAENDPWEWRLAISRGHKAAYGKIFAGKAGYISLEYLPYFANARRRGYDFEGEWEDGIARHPEKMIMDAMNDGEPRVSFALRREAGFAKGGEKNFESVLNALQMRLYLVMSDYAYHLDKYGREYGWASAVYARPEDVWGEEYLLSAYGEDPGTSYDRIAGRIREKWHAETGAIERIIGKRPT